MSVSNITREVFMASPRSGVAALGASYQASLDGRQLLSIHGFQSRSDTVDAAFVRHSEDAGRTWSREALWPTRFEHPRGTGRRHIRGGYLDPCTGHLLVLWTEGVLPHDEPLEGMKNWKLHYFTSADGGRTRLVEEQIIHEGPGYDAGHPLPGVTIGRNCVMMGDLGQCPLTRRDGEILVPVQSSPLGPDGQYHNPGAGFTYTDCLLLIGRWRVDGGLKWTCSQRVLGDPQRTTRGLIEPTLAELHDGTILMVMRGSNDARPQWPGHKWMARSHDGGHTWTIPQPWTYADGVPFFSPSSCSQLLTVADGRIFWMGNLCTENPVGNLPRYPLVLGQVDQRSGLLIRDSVHIIDDRRPEDSPRVTLSNFFVRQDQSGDLLLHLTRLYARGLCQDGTPDWTADALLYRFPLPA